MVEYSKSDEDLKATVNGGVICAGNGSIPP